MVLHDLRLDDDGDVAQIDHLLINRVLDFFVLDSKGYHNRTVRITDSGDFYTEDDGEKKRIASPLAQNDRHILVLKRALEEHDIVPKRPFAPDFHNYILFSPTTEILKPEKKSKEMGGVMHADLFYKEIERIKNKNAFSAFFENFRKVSSVISQESLLRMGEALLQLHQPQQRPNYRKRFGITDPELQPAPKAPPSIKEYYCYTCKDNITKEEADFCFTRKEQFLGRAYCRKHQQQFSAKKHSPA